MPVKYQPDRAAAKAAEIHRRAQALRDGLAAELQAAAAELATLNANPPHAFDAQAAAEHAARVEALDAVHGSSTAAAVAATHNADRQAAAAACAAHAARVAELDDLIALKQMALAGADAVLTDARENSKAATALAARQTLAEARARYRAAAVQVLGLASDLWALESLAQLATWPDSRAFSTRFAEVPLPAFGSFDMKADNADLIAVGGQFEPHGDMVRLRSEQARVQAMADFHAIRAQLEGTAQ